MASGAASLRAKPPARPAARAVVDYGALAEHLGYAVRRVQLLIFQDFVRTMDDLALRPAQYSLLTLIGRNPGLKQTRLGETLGIKSANLVALVDELVGRGLARRGAAPGDRRSHALYLTAKGGELLREASARAADHERRLTRHVGDTGKARLLTLLRALEAGLAGGAPATKESKARS